MGLRFIIGRAGSGKTTRCMEEIIEKGKAGGRQVLIVPEQFTSQTERDFIRQRQAEGIAAAKERGVRFGRRRIPMSEDFEALAQDWWYGRISAVQAGKKLGISRITFKNRAEEWGAAEGLGKRLVRRL